MTTPDCTLEGIPGHTHIPEVKRTIKPRPGLTVTAVLRPNTDGQMAVQALHIYAATITANDLRQVSIRQLETLDAPPHPSLPLTRPDGTNPDGHARLVAEHYRHFAALGNNPAKLMAEKADVPVTTVHRWIRDARRAGVLGPARKGRTG